MRFLARCAIVVAITAGVTILGSRLGWSDTVATVVAFVAVFAVIFPLVIRDDLERTRRRSTRDLG